MHNNFEVSSFELNCVSWACEFCRWQIRCLGMQRRLVQATSTSQRWDTMCIAMRCTAWTRRHQMHWGGFSRKEERTWGLGDRLVISHLWALQLGKVGTLMPFSMRILVWPFGMCPRSCVNFVMLSAIVPLLLALCLPGLISCLSKLKPHWMTHLPSEGERENLVNRIYGVC